MELEVNMFLTIVIILLSVMGTVICALFFFGGSEALKELNKITKSMEKLVIDNDRDHSNIRKRLLRNEQETSRAHQKIDNHLLNQISNG